MLTRQVRFVAWLCMIVAMLLTGCAAIETKLVKDGEPVHGLAYHLPMRYFILTLTRENNATTAAVWSESSLFPDVSKTYVLQYQRHLFGQADITVNVTSWGLLTTANSKVTDSAEELGNITRQTASSPFKLRTQGQDTASCGNGTIAFIVDPGLNSVVFGDLNSKGGETGESKSQGEGRSEMTFCGDVKAVVRPLLSGKGIPSDPASADHDISWIGQYGIFYRQMRPYYAAAEIMVGKGNGATKQFTSQILMAPNQSPAMLLPYARTLFAANDGSISLQDGMPTGYVQSSDSEFIAMLKMPAAVLSAYFSAVGNVFEAFAANAEAEQSFAQRNLAAAIQERKNQECLRAFRRKETETKLNELGCLSGE